MLRFTESKSQHLKELWNRKRENWRTVKPSIKLFGTRNNYKLASLHASSVSWKARPFLIFRELLRSCLNRVASLWHSPSRTCVISRGKVSLLDRCQTQISLAVTGLWGSGKVSLLASKKFLVMSLQLATVPVFFFTCFQVPTFRL